MKKTLAIVTIILAALPVFPINDQYIWSTDSPAFRAMETLYTANGLALPSGTGPWSNAEMKMMLSRLDSSILEETYSFVRNQLYRERGFQMGSSIRMEVDASLDLTFLAHTNTDFDNPYDSASIYMYNENQQKHMLEASWQAWVTDSFYSYFSFFFGNYNERKVKTGQYSWDTSIYGITHEGDDFGGTDMGFPYRAFVSAGGQWWSIMFGRDRVRTGSGETGNLTVSDNMPYQNILKVTAFSEKYKYTMLASFFSHPINWGFAGKLPHTGSESGILFYIQHRIEFSFLQDRLTVIASEGLVHQNEEGTILLHCFNPCSFMHNFYNNDNENSTASLELGYSPAKGFSFYFQVMIDDFATPFEGDDPMPNQIGHLIGVKFARAVGKGVLSSSLEAVLTDPYTYLRSVNMQDQIPGEYGANHLVAVRIYGNEHYNRYILGYTYQNDAIVLDLRTNWDRYGKVSLWSEFLLMFHGPLGIESLYRTGDKHKTWEGDLQTEYDIKLGGSYNLNESLKITSQLDYVSFDGISDLQFVIGANYSLSF